MEIKHYCIFIKVGEFQFMERLLLHGEIFCKSFKYFKSAEKGNFRHDQFEGTGYVEQIKDIRLLHPETKKAIAKAERGQLYKTYHNDSGNIYCLYGLERKMFDLTSDENKPLNLNMDGLNFGDTVIIIFDPKEFTRRVKNEVKRRKYSFQRSPVIYYDQEQYEGELSPFYKAKIYSPQNEVRFWIPNKSEEDLCFNIGNISDIAFLLPKSEISNLGYSRTPIDK